MCTRITQLLAAISTICIVVATCGCSIFVSAPPTAKIRIQGLDNKLYEYIIALDEPADETNVGFRISKKYTLKLDFEWLWDSATGSQIGNNQLADEDTIPLLVPWIVCNYRF
jgi:type 1 fimbria pilin